MPAPWDVVVIGAGASGLAAAHELSRSDLRVAILEARSRVGGRIHTRRSPSLPVPIEMGAEFIHGKPEITWRFVEEFGLRVCDVPDTHWTRSEPPGKDDNYWARFDEVLGRMRMSGNDRSIDEFLDEECRDAHSHEIAPVIRSFIQSFHAADPAKISEHGLAAMAQESQRTEENKAFRLMDGYDTLIHSFQEKARPHLFLETVVTEIEWEPGIVRISALEKGMLRIVEANRVIITLPLGVLKAPPGTPGYVRFDPALPEKLTACRLLEMGPVSKVAMEFSERFWEKSQKSRSIDQAAFFHCPNELFPVFWTTLPVRSPLIVAWTGGPPALEAAKRGLHGMIEAALSSFGKFFDMNLHEISRFFVKAHYYDWQNDPFSLGAYSYAAVGGKGAHKRLAEPVCDTLFFAGEATDYESQNATVAGALSTGVRAAKQILSIESLSRI